MRKKRKYTKYHSEAERKAAHSLASRKWAKANPEKIKKTMKKYNKKNRAKINARAKAKYKKITSEAKAYREGAAVPQAQTPAPATDAAALARIEALEKENMEMKKDMEMICTDLTKLEKLVKWPQAGASK